MELIASQFHPLHIHVGKQPAAMLVERLADVATEVDLKERT